MTDRFLIFGWPGCGYAQKAEQHAKAIGADVTFIDITQDAPEFLRQLPTYGSGPGRWQSPHVFRYMGGSSEFRGDGSGHEGCRRALDKIICD